MSERVDTNVAQEPSGSPSVRRSGLSRAALGILAVVCLVVGVGAGIGAGYGIFHENSTAESPSTETPVEEWLVVVSADNGTMAVDPSSGLTSFQVNGLRSRAPAYTNYPERIATLATMDTAMDFIDEGVTIDGGANVILAFESDNARYTVPVFVGEKGNVTGDSATFLGIIGPEVLVQSNVTDIGAFSFEDAHLFVIAGSAPSSLDFS